MNAQVSVEFLILVSVLLLIFLVIFFYSSNFQTETISTKIYNDAKKIADDVATEINLAAKVGDGYRRKFYVPTNIFGLDFNLTARGYFLILEFKNGYVLAPIVVENISGNISKGWNIINNTGGFIYVESTSS
jgi:uncharacterized protein (UPF0333 family)